MYQKGGAETSNEMSLKSGLTRLTEQPHGPVHEVNNTMSEIHTPESLSCDTGWLRKHNQKDKSNS